MHRRRPGASHPVWVLGRDGRSTQPVVLSHSSSRSYFPNEGEHPPRYPCADITESRERLQALARNGGVFGVNFFYADDAILNILGGNYLRVFKQVWKE